MFRTIIALVVALVVSILIGAFQILGLTIETIQTEILGSGDITNVLAAYGGVLFQSLMIPYTRALAGNFAPLAALGVAGFIAGLISKSGMRMLVVSIITIVLFFVGYAVLAMSAALDVDILIPIAQNIAIDLGVAFGLLFIPGIIGASLTAEDY
ncbi:MAG: hypothetical protein ACFFEJ_09525 [Candidatus Thorarchaeota archaeon]